MIYEQAIVFIQERRDDHITLMEQSEYADQFFFYKGKVLAYNEVLRILQDD